MDRFTRRAIVLQGRRSVTVDPALAARSTDRAKVGRAVRVALRRGRAVVLRTVRWDAVPWWLDDLTADLASGSPSLAVCRLDMSIVGKDEGAWTRVPALLAVAMGVPLRSGGDVASREAFVVRLRDLLLMASRGPVPRVVVFEDVDQVGATMAGDLMTAWREARRRVPVARMPRVLLTARSGGVPIDGKHAVEHALPDPTEAEALVMLAELLGPTDPERLRWIVDAVGPVPAFLARVAKAGGPFDDVGIREALGGLTDDIRAVVHKSLAQDVTADRLRALAQGSLPSYDRADRALTRAGLVSTDGVAAWLRSPLFADALRA